MPKNKKRIAAAGLAAVSVFNLCTAGTLAYWRSTGITENNITTGVVDGTIIEEYTEPQGGIYPGDTVDNTVNIRNDGTVDMVVRVKIEKNWDDQNELLDSDKIMIDFDTEHWLDGNDGYYYYKGILSPGETTVEPLMDSFTLDTSASNEYMGKNASIIVSMDCLQATSNAIENVWKKSYEELQIERPQNTEEEAATVEFTKDHTFEFHTGKDIFRSFKVLTPGETRNQTLEIKNSSNEDINMFLNAQPLEEVSETVLKFLREYGTITVTDDTGKLLYSGSADSSKMSEEITLGTFLPGESKKLNIALAINPEAGNEYQELKAENIHWVFTAQGEEKVTGTPNTSDDSGVIFWCIVSAVISGLIALLLLLLGKEKKKEEVY